MKQYPNTPGGWAWYVDKCKELTDKEFDYEVLLRQYITSKKPEQAIQAQGVFK